MGNPLILPARRARPIPLARCLPKASAPCGPSASASSPSVWPSACPWSNQGSPGGTPIFSLVIYAGSVEYLAISMVTSGMGPLTAAFTGGMINVRHIFYGITFPRHRARSCLARAYVTYALTDEVYAIVSAKRIRNGTSIVLITALCQTMWVLPGICGALLGLAFPDGLQGMEFALVALFVVLAFESFNATKSWALVGVAVFLGLASYVLFPSNLLVFALSANFVFLLGRWRLRNAR